MIYLMHFQFLQDNKIYDAVLQHQSSDLFG